MINSRFLTAGIGRRISQLLTGIPPMVLRKMDQAKRSSKTGS